MTKTFSFSQVDVFSRDRLRGNALAVVHDADGLSDADMAAFARWTNLSETTFLLKPTQSGADYRVRIFTPREELPFAGHPTLGSCHAWLAGGTPSGECVVQECGAGLIPVRRSGGTLAFQAPPLTRSGPVDKTLLTHVMEGLGLPLQDARAAEWVDNGPGWMAILLSSRDKVLSVEPDFQRLKGIRVGIVARCNPLEDKTDADFEVRGFTAAGFEDAVTGSLNAGIACWLTGSSLAPARYVAAQGTTIGRAGRITVERQDNQIWIGGHVETVINGTVTL